MRKKGLIKKLMVSVSALCLCAAFALATPAAAISAHAMTLPGISTYKDNISYVYKIEDNKLYKCLYNYTSGNYIGDWIYVRDL